jgi:hypothetical protein
MKDNEMNGICFKKGNTQKCVENTWTYFVDQAWVRIKPYNGSLKLGLDC